MTLPALPQHDRKPTRGDADERSGNYIAEKMEIGSHKTNRDYDHADAVEHPIFRIAYPQY